MKVVCLIPARYEATRFPGKLMQQLGSKTIIRHTYENTVATGLFDNVYVATDSDIIANEISSHGGQVKRSTKAHESGSDRIAEAAENMDVDIIVNVQGDEPFINKELIRELLATFDDPTVQVASAMQRLTSQEHINDPNYVKVAVDRNMKALFFSRSVIPHPFNSKVQPTYYEHIGLYAFRKEALISFYHWEMTPLEAAEKVECLRYLENGYAMKMVLTEYMGIEIDTPADLERAAKLLEGGE